MGVGDEAPPSVGTPSEPEGELPGAKGVGNRTLEQAWKKSRRNNGKMMNSFFFIPFLLESTPILSASSSNDFINSAWTTLRRLRVYRQINVTLGLLLFVASTRSQRGRHTVRISW